MKTRWITLFWIICLSGCVSQQESRISPLVTHYETQDNLRAANPVGCIDLAKASNLLSPADLYPGVRACIDAGEYQKAAGLFALAGVYGRYDKARVLDRTAHQAIFVIRLNTLSSVTNAQNEAFMSASAIRFKQDSKELLQLCNQIKHVGAPAYKPVYMLQHGMSAFRGVSALATQFDADKAWDTALDGFLHCPK